MTHVLLHCCCAPCSSAIIEWMLQHDVRPTLYYCNPNIYPYDEYLIRKNELTRYAATLGLDVIDDDYDHEDWLRHIAGLEDAPERGPRCLECFKYRLLRAARQCRRLGFEVFTTTLASSRWKRQDQIDAAGLWAAAEVNGESAAEVNGESAAEGDGTPAAPVTFDTRNWRKGGLQERRGELLRINGFYNQQYCGCEFSFRQPSKVSADPSNPSNPSPLTPLL